MKYSKSCHSVCGLNPLLYKSELILSLKIINLKLFLDIFDNKKSPPSSDNPLDYVAHGVYNMIMPLIICINILQECSIISAYLTEPHVAPSKPIQIKGEYIYFLFNQHNKLKRCCGCNPL